MPYDPPGRYRRTDAERRDQLLSWTRPDRNFFAAGACHILAYEFLDGHHGEGFGIVGLRRPGASYFDHVYVSDGTWAFDFCGWNLESEVLAVTRAFEDARTLTQTLERIVIDVDLNVLCVEHNHRPPEDFACDPRPRAARYLTGFSSAPPAER